MRKSLRTALSASDRMRVFVAQADPRVPASARAAVVELALYAKRLSRLADELTRAIDCEINRNHWRAGKSYVE